MQENYTITAVGRVSSQPGSWSLHIDGPYREALRELDGFSHINVLFWCHLLDEPLYRELVVAERPYKAAPDQVGIFATRSPARPNPIALTAVPVLGIDHDSGVIQVAYIDAEDQSPILDIKPYLPAVDRIRQTDTPQWCADWPQWYEDSATFDWGAVFENAR